MWFVDNLSKIIFSEDNLLCEKIYQMLIRFYIDRVQNMQSLVLSRQVHFAVEALWFLVNSLHAGVIFVTAATVSGSEFFLAAVYIFPENNIFLVHKVVHKFEVRSFICVFLSKTIDIYYLAHF